MNEPTHDGDAGDAGDELALLVADVYELAGALRGAGEELAAVAGQTQARWQLLSVASTGDATVSHAARRLGVSRQAVQRVADLLVKDGLARYDRNPDHRRSPHLHLTDRGRDKLAAITEASRGWRASVAAELSQAELRRTRKTLADIRDGVAGA
ncbi:MAG: MarR family transcriptional regulator [Thermoleophilaceae bacterium]|nr:MarR family transcriptional regulator [Thermoleophilaceae bacterium]